MVWGKSSDRAEHARRSRALTAAYDQQRARSGAELAPRLEERLGSRGGAPIWVMREAWMPPQSHRICIYPDPLAQKCDPDGFAIYGRYPRGWLDHVLKLKLLGDVRRDEILHVCSGTLGPTERWTVDLRRAARPQVIADGTRLPFRDGSFRAVMLDPPYGDAYAKQLYGTKNPRPNWLLKEAARVVCGGGRIGILHVAVPFAPPGCSLVRVYGVSTGVGFRIRAFTLYQKVEASMFEGTE